MCTYYKTHVGKNPSCMHDCDGCVWNEEDYNAEIDKRISVKKEEIDFSELSVARLGKAYVRMNSFEWDDICGPKPEGFDEMPDKEKYKLPAFDSAFRKIQLYLTREQMSMFWWILGLGKTYDEWREWYDDEHVNKLYPILAPSIVRCKDCALFYKNNSEIVTSDMRHIRCPVDSMNPVWFCADGVRKSKKKTDGGNSEA